MKLRRQRRLFLEGQGAERAEGKSLAQGSGSGGKRSAGGDSQRRQYRLSRQPKQLRPMSFIDNCLLPPLGRLGTGSTEAEAEAEETDDSSNADADDSELSQSGIDDDVFEEEPEADTSPPAPGQSCHLAFRSFLNILGKSTPVMCLTLAALKKVKFLC